MIQRLEESLVLRSKVLCFGKLESTQEEISNAGFSVFLNRLAERLSRRFLH